jgi:hypothetical protein
MNATLNITENSPMLVHNVKMSIISLSTSTIAFIPILAIIKVLLAIVVASHLIILEF